MSKKYLSNLLIGTVIGIIMPFFFSLCLFGTTLQTFVSGAGPTPGYWSGAPTPIPTRPPGPIRTWTGNTFSAAGGAVFILWSVLGALVCQAVALRRWRGSLTPTRDAIVGAVAGSLLFIAVALCGFLK